MPHFPPFLSSHVLHTRLDDVYLTSHTSLLTVSVLKPRQTMFSTNICTPSARGQSLWICSCNFNVVMTVVSQNSKALSETSLTLDVSGKARLLSEGAGRRGKRSVLAKQTQSQRLGIHALRKKHALLKADQMLSSFILSEARALEIWLPCFDALYSQIQQNNGL